MVRQALPVTSVTDDIYIPFICSNIYDITKRGFPVKLMAFKNAMREPKKIASVLLGFQDVKTERIIN